MENLDNNIAQIIKNAKKQSGMTTSSIAEAMHKDDKTITNWMRGKATPSFSNLIKLFKVMQQPLMMHLLPLIYPHLQNVELEDVSIKRKELVHYLDKIASDAEIEKLHFLTFGLHGSSWYPQLEEFVALDHLPLKDKVHVAKIIQTAYEIADARHELVATEYVLPDMDVFTDAIEHGRLATIAGKNSYNIFK